MTEPPLCPICKQPAGMVVGPTQAICYTDDCAMLMFDPTLPPEDWHKHVQVIDVDGLFE